MILSVISEYISIDKLQKENEKEFVHFLSRPVDSLGDLDNWDSIIYTTKSIARAVIIRHPGTLHLFRIIESNQPFDIKVDGKSCRVIMFENSGLAENLAIYFKGDSCTALYTGSFTRCRALLLNTSLHHYVLKGIDVMYVDNTAVRSLDPVSVYSASAEILQITKKYPDHQIIMSVPPFGYEDLIFSLVNAAKMKVFVEGAHLFAFEKHQISDIFEQDSQKAKVIVKEEEEEEVTLEIILKRFVEEKIITLRILLCELPPKKYYENIGLFEVHWSPHPSLSEIYTLVNYINPKIVREIDSMPKLPSFLFVKKESKDTNNSVAVNFQVRGDLSGRSTPVSEIEELSAAESYNIHNYRQKGRDGVDFQSQFDSFVQNSTARLHQSAWKYYSLPKRIARKAKRDHQENTTVELNDGFKVGDVSNDFPSMSTFSSFDATAGSRKDQHATISWSRKSRENKRAQLIISSTPSKDGSYHQAKSIGSDKEDSSYDISSMSTFCSLSSVESDFNLSDQINKSKTSAEAHLRKISTEFNKEDSAHDIPSVSTFSSLFSSIENDLNLTDQVSGLNASRSALGQSKDCTNPINNTWEKDAKGNQAKAIVASETTENQLSYELPSIPTFSSLSISAERNLMWNNLINEAVSRINILVNSSQGASNQSGKKDLQNGNKSESNTSKDNKKAHQEKSDSAVNPDKKNRSYDISSVSTFSSLSSSVGSDFNFRDQINGLISQTTNASKTGTGIQSGQNGDKIGKENTEPIRNTPKKGNQANGLNMNATKGNHPSSHAFPFTPTTVERNPMWNDLINEVVSRLDSSFSQSTEKCLDNVQNNQGDKALNNGDKLIKNTSEKNKKNNRAKGLNMSLTKGNRRSSYEFSSIPTAVERNSMWNDLINEVVSQIDISLSQSTEKCLDNMQSNQGQEDLNNGNKSIRNTSEKNERGPQNKPVVCSNECQQSHQSSVSTFSSLSSPDGSNCQLNDETNKMMSQRQVKTKSFTATDRKQNRSKKRRTKVDNTRSKQYEQKSFKRSGKSPKKGKIVHPEKTRNQMNRPKGDHLSGSTFSAFNQVNEIMSQLHIQKPHKIVGTFTGRTHELFQIRRQNAETVQNKHILKKCVAKTKGTSKKDGRDLEEDAQVVPNVSDGIDSDTSEEFNSSRNLLSDDILSVSTFTSLSLSSSSDERPTPGKSRKVTKKKKQRKKMSKPRRLEKERTSEISTANYHGQFKEAEQRLSRSKPRSKKRGLEKKELDSLLPVPHITMKINAMGSGGQQEEIASDNDTSHSPKSPCMSLLSFTSSERERFSNFVLPITHLTETRNISNILTK